MARSLHRCLLAADRDQHRAVAFWLQRQAADDVVVGDQQAVLGDKKPEPVLLCVLVWRRKVRICTSLSRAAI